MKQGDVTNEKIMEKLNEIEEQVKVLTEEYDLLNRYVYSQEYDEIEYR